MKKVDLVGADDLVTKVRAASRESCEGVATTEYLARWCGLLFAYQDLWVLARRAGVEGAAKPTSQELFNYPWLKGWYELQPMHIGLDIMIGRFAEHDFMMFETQDVWLILDDMLTDLENWLRVDLAMRLVGAGVGEEKIQAAFAEGEARGGAHATQITQQAA